MARDKTSRPVERAMYFVCSVRVVGRRVAPMTRDDHAVAGQAPPCPTGERVEVAAVVTDLGQHDQVERPVGPFVRYRTALHPDMGKVCESLRSRVDDPTRHVPREHGTTAEGEF